MSYQNYVISRNWSWKKLIYHNEKRLPIKISKICEAEGVEIIPYKDASDIQLFEYWRNSVQGDGFAIDLKGRKFIFYNDACTCGQLYFCLIGSSKSSCLALSSISFDMNRSKSMLHSSSHWNEKSTSY